MSNVVSHVCGSVSVGDVCCVQCWCLHHRPSVTHGTRNDTETTSDVALVSCTLLQARLVLQAACDQFRCSLTPAAGGA